MGLILIAVDIQHESKKYLILFADICWLRLDFETFSIVGPTTTTEVTTTTAGGNCPDQFRVTVTKMADEDFLTIRTI